VVQLVGDGRIWPEADVVVAFERNDVGKKLCPESVIFNARLQVVKV
jgi:hypothetical protein